MVIEEVSREDVLALCRKTVGLPDQSEGMIEDTLIAGLLRRAAGYLSPCSRAALRSSLVESLQKLTEDAELSDRIDNAIDWLLIGGDLLELNDVTTSDPAAKGTWVYPAPPSFVVRPSGSIFLTGTVPDQETFLPMSLASRVVHDGFVRLIQTQPGENIARELSDYGLHQLPEAVWLKAPREEDLGAMMSSYKQMLDGQGPSGEVPGLSIIDPTMPVRFYKGRWRQPTTSHSGLFVARRPQEFGSSLWGLVLLQDGRAVRFLDLPKKQRSRWRGSDEAWLVQMAMDRQASNPQRFRRTEKDDGVRFDFFSPLPSWAQRRLMLIGRSVKAESCLMSFILPSEESQKEEQFLRKRLWLANIDEQM